ncbi:MAG: XdhC family protein [Lachnospiraceae bacterium]|nr:XdhC family protein [Lachnospiraceae bacterium]
MDRLSFFKELADHPRFRDAVLCTILSEEGSTPRKSGTHMAVFPDGSTLGTVGGGGVERIAAREAAELFALPRGSYFVREYDLDGTTRDTKTGMICGGAVRLFFCYPDEAALGVLAETAELKDGVANRYLLTEIPSFSEAAVCPAVQEPSGNSSASGTRSPSGLKHRGEPSVRLTLLDDATLTAQTGIPPLRNPRLQDHLLIEPVTLRGMVYLFGLGHVGRALFPLLRTTGFPVVIIDDRKEALDEVLFADAYARLCLPYGMPSEELRITEEDLVVITTAGHRGDFEVLSLVLPLKPSYIGCIGSRRKAMTVSARLIDAGFDGGEVAKIHSPIGLAIGAQTPAEIAVSIAAELIAHRAARRKGDAV